MTALKMAKGLREGKYGAQQLVQDALAKIKAVDERLGSVVSVYEDTAMEQAAAAQARIDAGKAASLLDGIPVGIKDILCVQGQRAGCGSRMLEGFESPYDAAAMSKLKDAGGVLCARLNMDEFGMGSTTETSVYGVTRNPYDLQRVPGGSSGGCTAAVAAGLLPYAIGSDTGGSVRQPASHCGVTGFKPSYGAVSRYGLIAYASSLDQIGPIARDARDCAAILDVLQGRDPMDATSRGLPGSCLPALSGDVRGLKIGLPAECFMDGPDQGVRKSVLRAADIFRQLGAQVSEFSLPQLRAAVPAYYIIACAEASSNLARYDGVKYGHRAADAGDVQALFVKSRSEGFGREVKRRILLGSFVLSSGYYDAYYLKALQAQQRIKAAYEEAFTRFDLLLTPAAPTTAPRLGESLQDPLAMYLSDVYTVPVNLAGLPAISMPCGSDEKGLPIGAQLIGRGFEDALVLRAADAFQQASDFHGQRPPLFGGEMG